MATHSLIPIRVRDRFHREENGLARERESVKENRHISVMTSEVLEYLAPKDGDVIVDATFGAGGHSKALKSTANIHLISIDADPSAGVIEANFSDIEHVLSKLGIEKADKILFDLGWNSEQLSSGRGFSFQKDEPLNMSYGPKPASGFTAAQALNEWDEQTLADVFYGYGEERYSRQIAKAIVARREIQPIQTTFELVEVIRDSIPAGYRHGRIHFATRVFQALRIAVNDEMGVLEKGLAGAWKRLSCGGRIAVITFHSIEDRKVKQVFAQYTKDEGKLILKKPLSASQSEVSHNPRARSAKLRVIEKVCN